MFSCFLIGEDSLLIQCGKLLLEQSCKIEAIVSPLLSVQTWAKKQDIPCFPSLNDFQESSPRNVDYIFSIVNSYILSHSVLKFARKGSINYHDSILPKYAGVNATTWALLSEEREHGVSWHLIDAGIDEGDLLKQVKFPILPEDTAFSLNLRCYEYAVQSFKDLLVELVNENVKLQKQDLTQRSYFGVSAILPNFGFIDWEKFSGEYIKLFCKATTLGHYNNNIGSLKLYLANDYILIKEVEISEIASNFGPGLILDFTEDFLEISTISKAIKVKNIVSKQGKTLSPPEVMRHYGLKVGDQLPVFNEISAAEKKFYAQTIKHESYWLSELKNLNEHTTFPTSLKNEHKLRVLDTISFEPFIVKSQELLNNVLSAILIYLYRLNNFENTTVSFAIDDGNFSGHVENIYSKFIPVSTNWDSKETLGSIAEIIKNSVLVQKKYQTFFTDIAARHSVLEGKDLNTGIVINTTGISFIDKLPEKTLLYFDWCNSSKTLKIYESIDPQYHCGLLNVLLNNLANHILNIFKLLIEEPHTKAAHFDFLTTDESKTLVNNWGKGETVAIPQKSIYQIFSENVKNFPHKTAIIFGEQTVTYLELDEMACKVAAFIREKNLPSQSLVGVYLQRSPEMLGVILGILKANCIYVPLDTRYPFLKIETIIEESKFNYLFTTIPLKENLKTHFSKNINLKIHPIEKILDKNLAENKEINQPSFDSLAYVMFTSGTTGTPKGVMISQKNVLNYCYWFLATTEFNENSIIDFSSSIAFDLSVPCTIAPLIRGGCVAICSVEEKTNPKLYLKYLKKQKVTHVELTPGYVEMLLHYPSLVKNLKDLRYMMLGADVVHTEEVVKWKKLAPHHRIVNEYGPTEATVSVTSFFIDEKDFFNEASVPIGRPAFNSSAYIFDKYKNLCPIGMKGELFIGGSQVAEGYLNKPHMTQEKFVRLTIEDKEEVLYRTGDLAAWLPGGYLQFFGRNDFQVKIQGYRIELPAIESVLLKIPEIEQAVVLVQKGAVKEKYLRAYMVSNNKDISIVDIKKFLAAHFPSYMIPKEFCLTDKIPLRDNEKIDLVALKKQSFQMLTYEDQVNEELSENEKIIIGIWQRAFHIRAIDHHADFFDLGGDSLLALQIMLEIKQYFKKEIPLSYLFEYPTIAKLTAQIEKQLNKRENAGPVTLLKLAKGEHAIPLFLVHPVGGSIFWYKHLASLLSKRFTVYGIQDPSIDGHSLRFKSLEDMASYYLQEIQKIYKKECFYLAGASFGATVAFEMANQLQALNKKVGFLGLIDGWAHYPDNMMKENTTKLLINHDKKISGDKKEYLANLEEYRKELLQKYRFPKLKLDPFLFKASELWNDFIPIDHPVNGWSTYIDGKINKLLIPGNHETMLFQPNVKSLAMEITNILSTSI
ncbi:peptide synthetase, non-ribosomal (plasmid) [Legionella adelaidensis]|uniref:Peptide synthetase, non-ribosomal n=1 Tax=Legionella adelaidensis TaxID=45056 RepID=A0A0W0R118_9GAMM|nr:amino acid adenylation domain-containing protein [Legionella adelaidensis]KTC64787.1 peptide synthetase, non-ribosomal [Legionella adelaidensis]VEH82700.1 peptide synthetase, non-ribosomal [Legionella adelaidensis]